MVLLYTPKITNRKKYIFDLIINNLCGYKYEITDNRKNYINYEGPKINYSKYPIARDELFLFSDGLLEEKAIKQKDIRPVLYENLHIIFPSAHTDSALPYDPFSAAFYFVSRYEEYLPYEKDIFGRFEANQSIAYKHGFLDKPVVNHYALRISQLLHKKYPGIKPAKFNKFRFLPTYDIDGAYAYKGKGVIRTFGGYMKSLIKCDFKSIEQRTKVLTGRETDPFDTYSFQIELHEKTGIKPYYFFLLADYGAKDKNLPVNNIVYRKLIKKIGDYTVTGIHPSFASNNDPGKLKEEIRRLSSILNREIKHSRQHFLILDLPDTYHRLMHEKIDNDFTMGFASHTGFRAGICSPFLFYDLKNDAVTNIMIYPFTVMDVTLKNYMKLNIQNSYQKVIKLIDEVYDVNGTFITLWHNESLCDCDQWKGWKELYLNIFNYAAKKQMSKK